VEQYAALRAKQTADSKGFGNAGAFSVYLLLGAP